MRTGQFRSVILVFAGASLLLAALPWKASGQRVQGAVSVIAGSATDVLGATSRAVTIAPSLAFTPDPRVLVGINGSVTRYDHQQWSLGGDGATALRVPIGGVAAMTLNADIGATAASYDFSYAVANAVPALELALGRVAAYAGVAASAATIWVGVTQSQTPSGPFGGAFGGTPPLSRTTNVTSRAARGFLFGANATLSVHDAATVVLGAREAHATIDTVPTVDRTISLSAANGRFAVGGTAGMRSEPGTSTPFGSATLSVGLSSLVALELNAGAYPVNHLIGTPAGRYFNVGFSLRTGGGPRPRSAQPAIAGVSPPAAGLTRLAIHADGATRVDVAGDFTNWQLIATHPAPGHTGTWFVDLRIPPGQYRYAFRIDGTTWTVPSGTTAVDDDFGGKSAWLTVSAPDSTAR